MTPRSPLLVFDGDCGFCTTWIARLERHLPVFPEARPWLAAIGYAFVARFRHRLPGGTPACALPRAVA